MHIYQVYIGGSWSWSWLPLCTVESRGNGGENGEMGVAVGGWGRVRQGSKQQKIKHAHKYTRN